MRDKLNGRELEKFIESHDVVYIRHSLSSTPEAYRKLISDGIAAVHYTEKLKEGVDSENLENHKNPDNYEGKAKRVLNRFKHYCNEGVIVFADYSDPPAGLKQKSVNIGIIPEHEHFEPVRYFPGGEDYPKGFIYKQAELHNYVTLAYAEAIPFLAIQPRGGTVIKWRMAEKLIKFFYRKNSGLKIDPESTNIEVLLPFQQEVLCSEYLRTKASNEVKIKYLLSPVGRGLKIIDIHGANDTHTVFAQVSLSKDEGTIRNKIEELKRLSKAYEGSKKLMQVYFGPDGKQELVQQMAPEIKFISMEEVFDVMRNTGISSDMLVLA